MVTECKPALISDTFHKFSVCVFTLRSSMLGKIVQSLWRSEADGPRKANTPNIAVDLGNRHTAAQGYTSEF